MLKELYPLGYIQLLFGGKLYCFIGEPKAQHLKNCTQVLSPLQKDWFYNFYFNT